VEGDPASTLTPGPPSPLGQGPDAEDPQGIEYTELALDSLDLKAQEELLSPQLTGTSRLALISGSHVHLTW